MDSSTTDEVHTEPQGDPSLSRPTTPKSILRRASTSLSSIEGPADRKKVTFEEGSLAEERPHNRSGPGGRLSKRSATIRRTRGGINMRGASAGPLLAASAQTLNLNAAGGHSPPSATVCETKSTNQARRNGGSWNWFHARPPTADPSISNTILRKGGLGVAGASGVSGSRGHRMLQVQEAKNRAARMAAAAVAVAGRGGRGGRDQGRGEAVESLSLSCGASPSAFLTSTASRSPPQSRCPSLSPTSTASTSSLHSRSWEASTSQIVSPTGESTDSPLCSDLPARPSTIPSECRSSPTISQCASSPTDPKPPTPGGSPTCGNVQPESIDDERMVSCTPDRGGTNAPPAAINTITKLRIQVPIRRLSPADRRKANTTRSSRPDVKETVALVPARQPRDACEGHRNEEREEQSSDELHNNSGIEKAASADQKNKISPILGVTELPTPMTGEKTDGARRTAPHGCAAVSSEDPRARGVGDDGSDVDELDSPDDVDAKNGTQDRGGRLRYRDYASGTVPSVALLAPGGGGRDSRKDETLAGRFAGIAAVTMKAMTSPTVEEKVVTTEQEDRPADEIISIAAKILPATGSHLVASSSSEQTGAGVNSIIAQDHKEGKIFEAAATVVDNSVNGKEDKAAEKDVMIVGKSTADEGGNVAKKRQHSLRTMTTAEPAGNFPRPSEVSGLAAGENSKSARSSVKGCGEPEEAMSGSTPSRSKHTPVIVTPPSDDSPAPKTASPSPSPSPSSCTPPNRSSTGDDSSSLTLAVGSRAGGGATCRKGEDKVGGGGGRGRRGRRCGVVRDTEQVSAIAWDLPSPTPACQPSPVTLPMADDSEAASTVVANVSCTPLGGSTVTPKTIVSSAPVMPSPEAGEHEQSVNTNRSTGVENTLAYSAELLASMETRSLDGKKELSKTKSCSPPSGVIVDASDSTAAVGRGVHLAEEGEAQTDAKIQNACHDEIDWEDLPLAEALSRCGRVRNRRTRSAKTLAPPITAINDMTVESVRDGKAAAKSIAGVDTSTNGAQPPLSTTICETAESAGFHLEAATVGKSEFSLTGDITAKPIAVKAETSPSIPPPVAVLRNRGRLWKRKVTASGTLVKPVIEPNASAQESSIDASNTESSSRERPQDSHDANAESKKRGDANDRSAVQPSRSSESEANTRKRLPIEDGMESAKGRAEGTSHSRISRSSRRSRHSRASRGSNNAVCTSASFLDQRKETVVETHVSEVEGGLASAGERRGRREARLDEQAVESRVRKSNRKRRRAEKVAGDESPESADSGAAESADVFDLSRLRQLPVQVPVQQPPRKSARKGRGSMDVARGDGVAGENSETAFAAEAAANEQPKTETIGNVVSLESAVATARVEIQLDGAHEAGASIVSREGEASYGDENAGMKRSDHAANSEPAVTTRNYGFCGWMKPAYSFSCRSAATPKGPQNNAVMNVKQNRRRECGEDAAASSTQTASKDIRCSSVQSVPSSTATGAVGGGSSTTGRSPAFCSIADCLSKSSGKSSGRGKKARAAKKRHRQRKARARRPDREAINTVNQKTKGDGLGNDKNQSRKRRREEEAPKNAGRGKRVRGWLAPMWSVLNGTVRLF